MGKTIGYYLLVLPFIFLATACKHSVKNNTGKCNAALSEQLKNLPNSGSIEDVQQTIHFYNATDADCHNAIARPVIDGLFSVLYTHQTYDTLIVPFLDKIAKEESLSPQHRARALLKISTYYLYGLEDDKRAMPYLEKAAAFYPQMNDSVKRAYYGVKAQLCLQQSNLKDATTYYLKCIDLSEKLKDSAALYSNISNFSTVYSRMGDYKKAAELKKKSANYFLRVKDYNNLIYGYIAVGTEYGLMRSYDSALHYFLLGVDLLENKGVHNPSMAFNLFSNMAGIKMGQSQYDSARFYYDKAKEQLKFLNSDESERVYIMESAPAYAPVKSVEPEIKKIHGYLEEYMKDHNYNAASNAHYVLYHTYYMQDKFFPALKSFITYDSLKSLIADQENKKYVAEMETKYNTQKKQLQIEGQQKEIRKQRAILGLMVTLLLALMLIIALFFTGVKLRRNRREVAMQREFTKKLLEQTEEERIRIARDLHDGVSQELMILKNQIDPEEIKHRRKIDDIINEIRAISRDLHPVMLEKIGLKASVEHICNQMMENNYIFISSDIEYHKTLNKAGELQMFRMIQEALNNIIKYAKAEAAKVTISENDKYVSAEIIDNGEGFDVEEALSNQASFGLLNIKERSKAMNGRTSIVSSNAGTIIKIEIPKFDV